MDFSQNFLKESILTPGQPTYKNLQTTLDNIKQHVKPQVQPLYKDYFTQQTIKESLKKNQFYHQTRPQILNFQRVNNENIKLFEGISLKDSLGLTKETETYHQKMDIKNASLNNLSCDLQRFRGNSQQKMQKQTFLKKNEDINYEIQMYRSKQDVQKLHGSKNITTRYSWDMGNDVQIKNHKQLRNCQLNEIKEEQPVKRLFRTESMNSSMLNQSITSLYNPISKLQSTYDWTKKPLF